ncbi:hypothetical protein BC629DRAFT_1596622 [Irpex lacteus]|nr:hypothetical protein BC629DRAFT_1596622 [Irpex lacteus]
MVATLSSESLGRTALLNLFEKVVVTVTLDLSYRAPVRANQFVVIRPSSMRKRVGNQPSHPTLIRTLAFSSSLPFARSPPHHHTLAFASQPHPITSSSYQLVLSLAFVLARSLTHLLIPSFHLLTLMRTRSLACLRSRLSSHPSSHSFSRPLAQILSTSPFPPTEVLFVQHRYAKTLSSQRLHRHLGRLLPDPSEPAVEGSLAPSPALASAPLKVE